MQEINLIKKQKSLIYLLQSFISLAIFLLFSGVGIILFSQIFAGGRITPLVLTLTIAAAVVFTFLTAFFYAQISLLHLNILLEKDSGGIRIKNNLSFPVSVKIGLATLARRNVGTNRIVYNYKLDWFKEPKEKTIEPNNYLQIDYPQNMPQGLYKDIIDTVRFAACSISYKKKNIWIGWFEPYLVIFFSTNAQPAMGLVYKKLVKICQKTHRQTPPSEEEIEKWLEDEGLHF